MPDSRATIAIGVTTSAKSRASTTRETIQPSASAKVIQTRYGARSEAGANAPSAIKKAAVNNGGIQHLTIDETTISKHLYTSHLPDPDLVIRTSGEMRLSNFLLWQLAYAEICVTPTLWPEFRGVHLLEGIAEYQKRDRRFGGLSAVPGDAGPKDDDESLIEALRLS